MRLFLLSVFISSLFFSSLQAQKGSLKGIVTDAGNNRPLTGATIAIKNIAKTTTDVDGNYVFTSLPAGNFVVRVSYVGYETKEIEGVQIKNNDVSTQDVSLDFSKNNTLIEVVVRTEARRENLNSILNTRKNSAVVSDAISADMIKKSPDKNTSDVLKRVSGTTIQENKFVVVRGMNDRYNEAMLNNALLPSSEPDRKTFAFDIFPSEIVDNITIVKSATPELPGSFSGGLIQINTKDVPDKNFFSIKAGIGANSVTTGKTYYNYKGGDKDWLGIDDGTRALPNGFPNKRTFADLEPNDKIRFAKRLSNDWAYFKKPDAPLNTSFQLSGGFNVKSQNNFPKFGAIFGVTYNSSYRFNEYYRNDYGNFVTDTFYNYKDSAFTRSILTSALANLALKLNANNKFFFNNLYSINSGNQTVLRSGNNLGSGFNFIKANSFFFVSNRIFNTQIGGDHYLNTLKLRIKWNAYYTQLQRNEPDYRRNFYFTDDAANPYTALITSGTSTNIGAGLSYFAKVKDDAKGLNLDMSLPFSLSKNAQTFKFGGSYYYDKRSRHARAFTIAVSDPEHFYRGDNALLLNYAQDSIFDPKHFNAKKGFTLIEDQTPTNHYDGSIKNINGYLMFDDKFSKNIRLVWGVRYESYNQVLNTIDNGEPFTKDTTYKDFLPSANLIYSVSPSANIRASFSRTVARPLYRELANNIFYDFILNTTISGNIDLTETRINNYEIRWEQYFSNAQYYSVSGFYKKFKDPIEQNIVISSGDSRFVNWINAPKATNTGIEIEGRKNLDFISKKLQNIFIYANLAFIKSKVNTDTKNSSDTLGSRPLQGQSPYVINASIQYNEPKTNLAITLLFNAVGNRIFLAGGGNQETVWEKTHPTLDLKLSKSFLKNGIIELSFADLLHEDDLQYWDLNRDKKYTSSDADRRIQLQRFGFNMSLAVGYRF